MAKPNFDSYREYNSFYDSYLVWDQYGYWCTTKCPDHCNSESIQAAKNFAMSLVEPGIKYWYEVSNNHANRFNGNQWGGKWSIYDQENKILFWENAVGGCVSEKRANEYITKHALDYIRLYSGVMQALRVYQKTGVACLPDWNTNKSDSFGYKNGKQNPVPRAREVLANLDKHNQVYNSL
jgi:hypothetical protein